MGRKINISEWIHVDFDIDFEDYKEDFLKAVSDLELLEECKKRKLLKDEDLDNKTFLGNDTFKRHLCDLMGLGYHVSNETLIESIKNNL